MLVVFLSAQLIDLREVINFLRRHRIDLREIINLQRVYLIQNSHVFTVLFRRYFLYLLKLVLYDSGVQDSNCSAILSKD